MKRFKTTMKRFKNTMKRKQSSLKGATEDICNATRTDTARSFDDVKNVGINEVAYRLVGTPIRISCNGGYLAAEDGKIKTGYFFDDPSEFVMEYVLVDDTNGKNSNLRGRKKATGSQNLVAFRLKDTNLYLSQNPYGKLAKAEALNSIAALPIPPEISREIVDFAVGQENISFEGEGFDYRAMQLEQGPPGLLQQFTLEGLRLNQVGVKSVYGKYWRGPHLSNTVMQSSHQLDEEDFSFSRVRDWRKK
ncbi:unnamed protein product [Cylindrotheca closterium]|uniref:Uncharacterized protein n=1 Tax=Cylindrotheca closterium TaxID=2856 RepID=A0AAD2FRP2_9STRA|nr:unnamed protein product [Cylindrotheca closterium]